MYEGSFINPFLGSDASCAFRSFGSQRPDQARSAAREELNEASPWQYSSSQEPFADERGDEEDLQPRPQVHTWLIVVDALIAVVAFHPLEALMFR